VSATAELDHIIDATQKATLDILAATEEIQEVAWTLREQETDIGLCDKIDQRATDIYTACSFQDITGQRTDKVVRALRFIEQRINAMIDIWDVDEIAAKVDDIPSRMQSFASSALREKADLLHEPHGKGLKQDDVDRMLTVREEAAATEEAASKTPDEPQERHDRFEWPDPLTFAELEAVKCATLFG
jgi:chemotaxis protein CheZ